jgi:hypothetical protein
LFHKLRLGDARFRGVDASPSESPSIERVAPERESTSSVSAPESDPFNPRPNPPPVNASMSSSYAHRDAVKSPYVACAYRTSPSRDPRTLPSLLRAVPYEATSGWRSKVSGGVERRRGASGLKPGGVRRDAPAKVLKDRRSHRERGRMGTGV